ncbi:Uncharacterised protein [uncultured archaeon]|nr:Uncharacterised protein [uncultured archaeon]
MVATGGAGFIVSNLTAELLAVEGEVAGLYNTHAGSVTNLVGLKGDLLAIKARCSDIPGSVLL